MPPSKDVQKLLDGFRKFRNKYFDHDHGIGPYAGGQAPKTLIIACSDSRVDPALVTNAKPGEIFVVRNVANLVPPYETSAGFHGVSAAIEFAVQDLKVENVIILGHRQCGGIHALMANKRRTTGFVNQWMSIANAARKRTLEKHKDADLETQCRACEMESIVGSIDNLHTFPFVEEAIKERDMKIYGIYFDLENGDLCEYDEEQKKFLPVEL